MNHKVIEEINGKDIVKCIKTYEILKSDNDGKINKARRLMV